MRRGATVRRHLFALACRQLKAANGLLPSRQMEPKRNWQRGDVYWALWIDANRKCYFPVFEGTVAWQEDNIVRFACGGWRFVHEGLAFASREEAQCYANENQPDENGSPRTTSPACLTEQVVAERDANASPPA